MNIKQAKNEVIRTVRAYLEKRDNGEYMIPVSDSVRYCFWEHRVSARRRSWNRWQMSVELGWYRTRSLITPDKVQSDSHLFVRRLTESRHIL